MARWVDTDLSLNVLSDIFHVRTWEERIYILPSKPQQFEFEVPAALFPGYYAKVAYLRTCLTVLQVV